MRHLVFTPILVQVPRRIQPKTPFEKALTSTKLSQAPCRALHHLQGANFTATAIRLAKNLGLIVQVSGCLSGAWVRVPLGPFKPGCGRSRAAALERKRKISPWYRRCQQPQARALHLPHAAATGPQRGCAPAALREPPVPAAPGEPPLHLHSCTRKSYFSV